VNTTTVTYATKEIGHVSPFANYGGFVYDASEEAAALQWPSSVATYSRMRRTDAQIRGTFQAITLPLRRPIWALDPEDCDPKIVSQLSEDLDLPILGQDPIKRARHRDRFSWAEHLRMALLSLAYGHACMEIVYETPAKGDKTLRLRKLAPRMPETIAGIDVAPDGGLVGIKQWPLQGIGGSGSNGQGFGKYIEIPVDKLVWYVTDKEGAAWQGQSIFRSCYRDFLLKDRLLRVQAMSIERTGMGVPVISAPENATDVIMKELQLLARNYRAGEESSGVLPYGATLKLVGIEGSIPDALPAINMHDAAIAKSMLAQFLQLGTTHGQSGNRSLGESQVDFFTLSLDAIAQTIADITTQHVVEDYVDLNWGSNVPAPKVVARAVDADVDIPPEVIGQLVRDGAIAMDDTLAEWLRERYAMPKPDGSVVKDPSALVDNLGSSTTPPDVTARRRTVRAASVLTPDPESDWTHRVRDALAALVDVDAILDARANGARPADAVNAGLGKSPGMLPGVLQSLLTSAYANGTMVAAAKLPVKAGISIPGVSNLSRLLSDTGERAGKMVQSFAKRLTRALVKGEDQGLERSFMVDLLNGVGADIQSAGLIAVTETRRAMISAGIDVYKANGIERTIWTRTGDGSNFGCECDEQDGEEGDWTEDDVPAHPGCLPGWVPVVVPADVSAQVTFTDSVSSARQFDDVGGSSTTALALAERDELAGGTYATMQRRYTGSLVEVTTAGGSHFAATPNHPVLTPNGWVPAGKLSEGDYVLGCPNFERLGAGDPDHTEVPAPIENVVRSWDEAFAVSASAVKVAAEDFHGDGAGSDVAVVRTDGLLRNHGNATGTDPIGQPLFPGVHDTESFFGVGVLDPVLDGLLDTPDGFVRSGGSGLVELSGPTGVGEHLGSGVSPDLNPTGDEAPPQRGTADPHAVSESLQRLAIGVAPDQVIYVNRSAFSGHVFNLAVTAGYYLAGGVVVANCSCSLEPAPVTQEEAA
jgi:hypothetical protein